MQTNRAFIYTSLWQALQQSIFPDTCSVAMAAVGYNDKLHGPDRILMRYNRHKHRTLRVFEMRHLKPDPYAGELPLPDATTATLARVARGLNARVDVVMALMDASERKAYYDEVSRPNALYEISDQPPFNTL